MREFTQKQCNISEDHVEYIIKLKYIHGSFSEEIDKYIR